MTKTPFEGFIDAVKNNNLEDVNDKLGQKVNVNGRQLGLTALHYATNYDTTTEPLDPRASEKNIKIIKALAEAKADINADNKNGLLPIKLATLKGKTEVVKLLLEKGADIKDSLHQASVTHQFEIIKVILETEKGKADVNKIIDGNTALNIALNPLNRHARNSEIEPIKNVVELIFLIQLKTRNYNLKHIFENFSNLNFFAFRKT
jgi:ankyrin repeat protein